jgi:hypothetical protein
MLLVTWVQMPRFLVCFLAAFFGRVSFGHVVPRLLTYLYTDVGAVRPLLYIYLRFWCTLHQHCLLIYLGDNHGWEPRLENMSGYFTSNTGSFILTLGYMYFVGLKASYSDIRYRHSRLYPYRNNTNIRAIRFVIYSGGQSTVTPLQSYVTSYFL